MLGNCIENVRKNVPLVHNITNYVTVNDVANILLACGGSPIMSAEPEDVEDITSICGGLNINIGTLTKSSIEGMFRAGRKANELNHPILLDPVGAGASALRTNTAVQLMEQLKLTVIRGNISEIKTLALGSGTTKGVDADVADAVTEETLDQAVQFVKQFAAKSGSIVAITGAIDLVSDGEKCYVIRNGRPEMGKITGTGCQLSGMMTAFLVANPNNHLEAAAAAVCTMGLAGEIGWSRMQEGDGNSTYRNRIIDAVYNMDVSTLDRGQNMKCAKEDLLLYAVTDRHWLNGRTLYEVVKESLDGGVTFLQLREKTLDEAHFLEEAKELQKLCKEYKVPFIINDNVDIAVAMNADGVHVGQSDMEAGDVRAKLGPDKIIGVSTQTVEQAILAEKHGADYLGVGAVFPTTSKDDAAEVSYDTLKAICEAVSIPVVAIGGITQGNVVKLTGSGIDGVAVISAIYAQKDIKKATADLKAAVKAIV